MARTTKSGVRVSDDFRDNLIIDRYDQVFAAMRGLKLRHLCSENSEDAVTRNVSRSLRQIDPTIRLPELARRGLQARSRRPQLALPCPCGCPCRRRRLMDPRSDGGGR